MKTQITTPNVTPINGIYFIMYIELREFLNISSWLKKIYRRFKIVQNKLFVTFDKANFKKSSNDIVFQFL